MTGTRKRKGMLDDICSAEEVVQALLDHFVEPFLPSSRTTQAPTPSQHRTIATQMHAVVVLYNYYHRKQNHEHEFLDFTSFCKLAVVLKPNLIAYMKLMRQADYSKMDDSENELSQTEKAILNACNVSTALDASKSVPVIDGWPMSKVAVFLVDSRKENCMLLDSAITHGAISVIEKDLYLSSVDAHESSDGYDARILDWAFSAVKNAAGIDKSDLVVLESYSVYSLDKPKAAARLYVMQCIQPNNDDFWFHIRDIIESLQGPLVKRRSSRGWMVTPVVKYFHMLPYTEALDLAASTDDQSVENSCGSLIDDIGEVDEQSETESQNSRSVVKVYRRLKKNKATSHSFLAVLCRLKQKLCEQLERVEGEILQCDMDIHAALNGVENK